MRKALASVVILVFASTICATLFAVLTSSPDSYLGVLKGLTPYGMIY